MKREIIENQVEKIEAMLTDLSQLVALSGNLNIDLNRYRKAIHTIAERAHKSAGNVKWNVLNHNIRL